MTHGDSDCNLCWPALILACLRAVPGTDGEGIHFYQNLQDPFVVPDNETVCATLQRGTIMGQDVVVAGTGNLSGRHFSAQMHSCPCCQHSAATYCVAVFTDTLSQGHLDGCVHAGIAMVNAALCTNELLSCSAYIKEMIWSGTAGFSAQARPLLLCQACLLLNVWTKSKAGAQQLLGFRWAGLSRHPQSTMLRATARQTATARSLEWGTCACPRLQSSLTARKLRGSSNAQGEPCSTGSASEAHEAKNGTAHSA